MLGGRGSRRRRLAGCSLCRVVSKFGEIAIEILAAKFLSRGVPQGLDFSLVDEGADLLIGESEMCCRLFEIEKSCHGPRYPAGVCPTTIRHIFRFDGTLPESLRRVGRGNPAGAGGMIRAMIPTGGLWPVFERITAKNWVLDCPGGGEAASRQGAASPDGGGGGTMVTGVGGTAPPTCSIFFSAPGLGSAALNSSSCRSYARARVLRRVTMPVAVST